jgi:hypothetical protein
MSIGGLVGGGGRGKIAESAGKGAVEGGQGCDRRRSASAAAVDARLAMTTKRSNRCPPREGVTVP